MSEYKIETNCIQAGYKAESGQPQVLPIVQNTTYRYYNAPDVAELFDLESPNFMYTRLGSPTVNALEEKMAALEGGTAGIATSAGQAANLIAMLNICQAGDHIIACANIYGGTHNLFGVTMPIVYTSSDSVFQIAANTAVIPLDELYEICKTARKLLVGKWACGRVIARPYIIEDGKRVRTTDRRDFAVSPPYETLLDKVSKTGQTVYAIGKISDIFNGKGVSGSVHTVGNMDGVDKTIEALKRDFGGFIFTNLVDFDTLYGHRRNPEGYGNAIVEFDKRLPEIMR